MIYDFRFMIAGLPVQLLLSPQPSVLSPHQTSEVSKFFGNLGGLYHSVLSPQSSLLSPQSSVLNQVCYTVDVIRVNTHAEPYPGLGHALAWFRIDTGHHLFYNPDTRAHTGCRIQWKVP